MFENIDGRRMDPGVIGILLAHPRAFGSGELKIKTSQASCLISMAMARSFSRSWNLHLPVISASLIIHKSPFN